MINNNYNVELKGIYEIMWDLCYWLEVVKWGCRLGQRGLIYKEKLTQGFVLVGEYGFLYADQ